MSCTAVNHPLNEVNRLGLAGGVEGGSGCWDGTRGKGQGTGRGCHCAWEFWLVHFPGKHVQMTNGSYFSALNVSYNCWLILPLATTTVVSILFDAHSQCCSDNRRPPAAACSAPLGRQSKAALNQSHRKEWVCTLSSFQGL